MHSGRADIDNVKNYLCANFGWDFTQTKETKELNLTLKLIAERAGFGNLMNIYNDDKILEYRDRIKKYINSLENNRDLDFGNKTFGEVIEILKKDKSGKSLKPILPTDGMISFIENNKDLYTAALGYNFSSFSKMYVDKDHLLDDKKQNELDENGKETKRDALIKHLYKIQDCIFLYDDMRYNEFLKRTDFRYKIVSVEQKRKLKKNIEELINVGEKSIEDIIESANDMEICIKDDSFEKFKNEKRYLFDRVKKVRFSEFQKLYKYLEGKTPFSTQHKIKGAQFDNVLVVLDNGGWKNYNFENLFLNSGTPSVLERSQKIFYVCCTRSKENLATFFHKPSNEVIEKAKEWFGSENIIDLDLK